MAAAKYKDITASQLSDISKQNRFVVVTNLTYAAQLAGANPENTDIGRRIDEVGAIAFVPSENIIYAQGATYGLDTDTYNSIINDITGLKNNTNGDILKLGQAITGTGVDGKQVALGTATTPIADALQDIWDKILQVNAIAASGAAGVSSISFTGATQDHNSGNVSVVVDGSTVKTKAATTGATKIAAATTVDSALNTLDNAIASANANILTNTNAIATANARITTLEGDVTTLKSDENTEGSVAKTVKDAVAAEAQARENADDALRDRLDEVKATVNADKIKLYKMSNGNPVVAGAGDYVHADGNEYQLIAGKTATSAGTVVAKFNIARDAVVSGGEVVNFPSGSSSIPTGVEANKEYLKLTIANGDDVYILVRSLVDVYTANNQSSYPVHVSIDANKNITADLDDATKASIALANTSLQPVTGKVTGTQDLIDMIESANATVTGSTYVTVTAATGSEGELNYTVSANTGNGGLALQSALNDEVSARQSADGNIMTILTGTPSGTYSPSGNVSGNIADLISRVESLEGQVIKWVEVGLTQG